jgi:hypothetical protein
LDIILKSGFQNALKAQNNKRHSRVDRLAQG